MAWFQERLEDFHKSSKKWDPITHYTLDATHDLSTKSVGETSHGIGKIFGDNAIGRAGKHWDQMADKDKDDFSRWGTNTLGAAAAIYGGMSALGGEAGAGAAEGGWTAGDTGLYTQAGDGAGGGGWFSNLFNGAGNGGWTQGDGGMYTHASDSGGGLFSGMGNGQGRMPQMNFGQSSQQSDSASLQRQLAVAEMIRRNREENERAAQLPGWVDMEVA